MDETPAIPPVYDEATGTFHLRHDWTGGGGVSETILHAIRSIQGSLPSAPTLWSCIDTDALDRLLRPLPGTEQRTDAALTFDFDDCTITLHGTGDIEIEPTPPFIVDIDSIRIRN